MVDGSIIVTTYNHAPYIGLCFRSIIEQTTSRRLRIVWHDDASTDETVKLGERELQNCPHEVVRIHRTVNRVSRRIPLFLDMFEQCQGEFLFMLDGDDCWASNNKVDLQIDALNANPDINLCFTRAVIAEGAELKPVGVASQYGDTRTVMSFDQVVRGDGDFMPTASLCFRRKVFDSAPLWLSGYIPVGDYPMQVIGSYPAGALYLPDVTSIYRTNIEGAWTTTVYNNLEKRFDLELEMLELFHAINRSFPGHKEAIMAVATKHFVQLLSLSVTHNRFSTLEKALLILKDIQ